jgi:hypothetical protein
MKLLLVLALITASLLPSCAYNSPGAKVDNRITINASMVPPTEQIITTR